MEWIKGHQDEYMDDEELNNPEKLNIVADKLVNYAYEAWDATKEKVPPFPAATISLMIDGVHISSIMKSQIQDAMHIA